MADTKLQDVGPDIGQLSTDLSFLERTQISATQNLGGSLSPQAGNIPGSIIRSLNGLDNTARSGIELGSNLAAQLENAGSVQSNARDFITDIISRAINNRTSLGTTDALGLALSDASTRAPSRNRRSVDETIDSSRNAAAPSQATQFPVDLVGNTPAYLRLNFKKYTRENPFESGKTQTKDQILLPLPENLTFSHSIKVQEADTGIYGDILKLVGNDLGQAREQIKNGNISAAFQSLASIGDKDAEKIVGTAVSVAERAAYAQLNSSDIGGLAGQLLQGIPNPHPTVFFKGVELRQFQWNWKLVPKRIEDAEAIQKIIAKLREYVIPSTKNSGNFLEYPYLILPEIVSEKRDINVELLYGKFKRSMATQLNINFSGEGTSAFFVDGRPVSINLSMVFMEVESYTNDN